MTKEQNNKFIEELHNTVVETMENYNYVFDIIIDILDTNNEDIETFKYNRVLMNNIIHSDLLDGDALMYISNYVFDIAFINRNLISKDKFGYDSMLKTIRTIRTEDRLELIYRINNQVKHFVNEHPKIIRTYNIEKLLKNI